MATHHTLLYIVFTKGARDLGKGITTIVFHEGLLVRHFMKTFGVHSLWLEMDLTKEEVQALATALMASEVNPGNLALKAPCKEIISSTDLIDQRSLRFEGVDRDFLDMIRLLNEAAKNRRNAREILKPWWNELKEIKHELDAYLDLYAI